MNPAMTSHQNSTDDWFIVFLCTADFIVPMQFVSSSIFFFFSKIYFSCLTALYFFKKVSSGSVDELHSPLYFRLSPTVVIRVPLLCFLPIASLNCVSRQLTVDIEYGAGTFLIHVGVGFVKKEE